MEQEPVSTATAKPKPKRNRRTKQQPESETIIDGTEREYTIESDGESDGESNGEPEQQNSPRWWSLGNSRESNNGPASSRESVRESAESRDTNNEETQPTVERSEATVTKSEKKPKQTQAKKVSGAIQGEDVERFLVQTFSWIALLKQASYWNIDDPQHEVRPWSPQAAELLNKLLAERAQQLKDTSDVMSVAAGMFVLVSMRVQADIALRKQRIMQARQEQAQEEQYGEKIEDYNGRIPQGIVKPSIFGMGGF